MKEAHSPDPGWRVLTCEHHNTRQGSATERCPWLCAGDGVGKEPYLGENTCPVSVSVYVLICARTLLRMYVCVCWGGLQSPMGKK